MAEQTLQEKYDALLKQHSDVMADGGSYRELQKGLDAALQKHSDDAKVNQAAIESLTQEHVTRLVQFKSDFEALHKQLSDTVAAHQSEIATLKQSHAEQLADVQAKADFAVARYSVAHDEMRAILNESPVSRSLRVQQAKEAEAFAAKQAADRRALNAKLP